MNKTELVAAIAEKAELSKKDAEKALKAFTDVVAEELKKGEKIQLVGFGTFEVSERAAREGRNPQSGETMKIAASKALADLITDEELSPEYIIPKAFDKRVGPAVAKAVAEAAKATGVARI